ncbi:MAG: ABC transporter substrate-binding protein, partial [Aeromonas sp.]
MFKKIALLLSLMTSMLFALSAHAAINATDPNALVDQAAKQTFARLKADQAQIKSNPDHLRVIIREELLPYVDSRFAAYKVLGSQIKDTTEAQRNAFVDVFTEYMVSSYADALAHFDKQVVKVQPGKAPNGNITSVTLLVTEAGKPDIVLEFKLRKNNKTGEWKAFDMVAEGISLLSAKQSELGGLIRQNGIDAVIAQLRAHNAKPLVL